MTQSAGALCTALTELAVKGWGGEDHIVQRGQERGGRTQLSFQQYWDDQASSMAF